MANIADDDDRYYVPFSDTVSSRPIVDFAVPEQVVRRADGEELPVW